MQVTAYIPCYNGAATLRQAIDGIMRQEPAVDELLVIDDGSSDESAQIAEEAGARVIRLGRRMGRGACRARGMAEARHPLVLCCDATIEIAPDFVARAARWFDDDAVAAVCGRIAQKEVRTVVDRWRARHLFRTSKRTEMLECADFITTAALTRADLVSEAGGYNTGLWHGEDADLGRRLLERGCKVIFDPSLIYWQLGSNTPGEALERYWRWNRASGRMTVLTYLKQIKFSITVMAREDMETADLGAALISLFSPHYQFWRDR